jgi:hypothetical protein
VKLAGLAQRAIRGAALVTGFVIVEGGDALRAVLTDVYAALGITWDPRTAGAVDALAPGVGTARVEAALLRAVGAGAPLALDDETLALAARLAPAHGAPGGG